jgi:hypothetical protein
MRYLAISLVIFALAACNKVPNARTNAPSANAVQTIAPDPQKTSMDSVVQFLMTSAVTDFHIHRPPDPVRFRDVKIGHVVGPNGEKQYRMNGEFLPAQGGASAMWTPFATIRTSSYEQLIGGQASTFSQDPSLVWDNVGDLSILLQNQMQALR